MREKIITLFILSLVIFPLVSADVLFPTMTNVYFEKNGIPYNNSVTFTIDCYGYSWEPGPGIQKEPGTYTPEKVFSFGATIKNYGDPIYEDYYMNYRHIDYCTLEGETREGKFSAGKFDSLPINCTDFHQIIMSDGTGDYASTQEYEYCIKNTEELKANYSPLYGPAANEKTGATRKDNNGNTWTKQSDGMWASNGTYTYTSATCEEANNCIDINATAFLNSTRWGDQVIDAQKGGITYASAMKYSSCDQYLKKILDSEIEKDDNGYPLDRKCELRINLSNNGTVIPNPEPIRRGFWESISCFFKKIFNKSC